MNQPYQARLVLPCLVLWTLAGHALAADPPGTHALPPTFERVVEALEALGYHGTGRTDSGGILKPLADRLSFFGETPPHSTEFSFCSKSSRGAQVWRSPDDRFTSEVRSVNGQIFRRSGARWSRRDRPDYLVFPSLRERLHRYLPPQDHGSETVRGVETTLYRARFDIDDLVAQRRAEALRWGGPFTDESEEEIRSNSSVSRLELFVDSKGFPRRAVWRHGRRLYFEETEIELAPGCKEEIVAPPEELVRVDPPPRPSAVADVRFGEERLRYEGGRCYRNGHSLSFHSQEPGYFLEVGVGGLEREIYYGDRVPGGYVTVPSQFPVSGKVSFGRGDDHYVLRVEARGVEVSDDRSTFSVSGELDGFRRGSTERRLAAPIPVRFEVTCPGSDAPAPEESSRMTDSKPR